MRKLIRYSVTAFLTWAVVTFAWAALSHVSGLIGPAEASRGSLELAAEAVTLVDPPGALGTPQRMAARQIRGAARTVERVHEVPERIMGDLLDRLGHAAAHGRRHRHVHRVRVEVDRAPEILVLPFDERDRASERARRRAEVELERHRERAERLRERADRIRAQAFRSAERARERARAELRLEGLERVAPSAELEALERSIEVEAEAMGRELAAELEGLARQLSEADSKDRKDEIKRKIEEFIEWLQRELEGASVEPAGLTAAAPEIDAPVRVIIRER